MLAPSCPNIYTSWALALVKWLFPYGTELFECPMQKKTLLTTTRPDCLQDKYCLQLGPAERAKRLDPPPLYVASDERVGECSATYSLYTVRLWRSVAFPNPPTGTALHRRFLFFACFSHVFYDVIDL